MKKQTKNKLNKVSKELTKASNMHKRQSQTVQAGVKTNQTVGQRKAFKSRHAKNISKGKMSAAYWADKVKWSPSKTKSPSKKWVKGS